MERDVKRMTNREVLANLGDLERRMLARSARRAKVRSTRFRDLGLAVALSTGSITPPLGEELSPLLGLRRVRPGALGAWLRVLSLASFAGSFIWALSWALQS